MVGPVGPRPWPSRAGPWAPARSLPAWGRRRSCRTRLRRQWDEEWILSSTSTRKHPTTC